MRLQIYSVRDVKSDFSAPFFNLDDKQAVRQFTLSVRTPNPDSLLHNFPEDYSLYNLGTFDSEKGNIELLPQPKHVLDAASIPKLVQ